MLYDIHSRESFGSRNTMLLSILVLDLKYLEGNVKCVNLLLEHKTKSVVLSKLCNLNNSLNLYVLFIVIFILSYFKHIF